jgi:lipoyl(octanoyl) transferase
VLFEGEPKYKNSVIEHMSVTRSKTPIDIHYQDLGMISYGKAWDLQESLFGNSVHQKIANRNLEAGSGQLPLHHLLLCEHHPVITLGKNANPNNLLVTAGNAQGVEIFHINRGGDVTFHGPGQLVGYPILDLDQYYTDIGRYLRELEEVIIRTIGEYGIIGDRLPGATGVWIDPAEPSKARKICAMGIRCSRWVTMHGFALNVNTDLSYFNMIVPCGITDKAVTSIQKELGKEVSMEEVKEHFCRHFEQVFNSTLRT